MKPGSIALVLSAGFVALAGVSFAEDKQGDVAPIEVLREEGSEVLEEDTGEPDADAGVGEAQPVETVDARPEAPEPATVDTDASEPGPPEGGQSKPAPIPGAQRGTWFASGYAVVAALFGMHTWGWWDLTNREDGGKIAYGDLEGGFLSGANIAGYYALRSGIFHIGGGINFSVSGWKRAQGSCCEVFVERTTLKQFSFGLNLKLGDRVGKRFWLGGALDFGPIVHITEKWEEEGSSDLVTENTSDADLGVRLFPYFAADVMLLNTEGFKLGIAIALGVAFVPGVSDIESSVSEVKLSRRYLTPMISIGPMLGG